MPRHTPGPWIWLVVEDFPLTVCTSATLLDIATVHARGASEIPWPQAVANARLIAAAPTMLAALKRVLSATDDTLAAAMREARAAVAAAGSAEP